MGRPIDRLDDLAKASVGDDPPHRHDPLRFAFPPSLALFRPDPRRRWDIRFRAMSPSSPRSGIVCVLAKQPIAGRVKTRLTPGMSPSSAASLAWAMLEDTWALVTRLPSVTPRLVFAGDEASLALQPKPTVWPQGEGDLGARLERCLQRALATAPWALVIGTDSPGLPAEFIEQAAALLSGPSEAVLGPTQDGGFYLIGLTRCPDGILSRLPWSSSDTYRATLERLERHASVAALEPWFDVDEPDDLALLERRLAEGRLHAPATAHALGLLSRNR